MSLKINKINPQNLLSLKSLCQWIKTIGLSSLQQPFLSKSKHSCLVFSLTEPSDCGVLVLFHKFLWFSQHPSVLLSAVNRDLRTVLRAVQQPQRVLISLFAFPSVHTDFPFTFCPVTSWFWHYFSSRGASTGTDPYYCLCFPFSGPDLKDTAICYSLLQYPMWFSTESKESWNVGQNRKRG